jgi:hypothetical protein
MKEVSFPTPHTRSDLGVRLRRELLSNARSNADLTAEAQTLHPLSSHRGEGLMILNPPGYD